MRSLRTNCLSRFARQTATSRLVASALLAGLLGHHLWPLEAQVQAQASVGFAGAANASGQLEFVDSYPYYIQSPIVKQQQQQQQQPEVPMIKQQRATIPLGPEAGTIAPGQTGNSEPSGGGGGSSSLPRHVTVVVNQNQAAPPPPPPPQPPNLMMVSPPQTQQCLYDKRYFLQLDQCLERKPYPTVGLPAFKNEDLLVKKGLGDKYGCSFILTNGLFKSYQINKYSLESDIQCLDSDKTSQVSIQFSNVTLYYLWQLRCLNYADQLLDDATLGGRTLIQSSDLNERASGSTGGHGQKSPGICLGSSQNFGFASLQMANVEAQVELSIDIYKNWRVTNVTLASNGAHSNKHQEHDYSQQHESHAHAGQAAHDGLPPGIRDITFESLDGDELNWRYLQLYENWTRNRLHVSFLDQFKRFLWVSLQRCLSESSEKLPVKLTDLFGHHKYN